MGGRRLLTGLGKPARPGFWPYHHWNHHRTLWASVCSSVKWTSNHSTPSGQREVCSCECTQSSVLCCYWSMSVFSLRTLNPCPPHPVHTEQLSAGAGKAARTERSQSRSLEPRPPVRDTTPQQTLSEVRRETEDGQEGVPTWHKRSAPQKVWSGRQLAGKAWQSRQGPAGAGRGTCPRVPVRPGQGRQVTPCEKGQAQGPQLGSCALTAVLRWHVPHAVPVYLSALWPLSSSREAFTSPFY